MADKITFFLNGELATIKANSSIAELITNLDLDPKKIAIEKDLVIVNQQDFANIIITANSKIEIVHFIGGG